MVLVDLWDWHFGAYEVGPWDGAGPQAFSVALGSVGDDLFEEGGGADVFGGSRRPRWSGYFL